MEPTEWRHRLQMYLDFEQQFPVRGLLQLHLLLEDPLLLLLHLELADVVDRGLEDGALVLPHVAHDVVIPAEGGGSVDRKSLTRHSR